MASRYIQITHLMWTSSLIAFAHKPVNPMRLLGIPFVSLWFRRVSMCPLAEPALVQTPLQTTARLCCITSQKSVHQEAWRGWRAELRVNKSSDISVTFLSGFQCIALLMSFSVLALNINVAEVSTAFILPKSDLSLICQSDKHSGHW